MAKEKRATEKLNVALSGISAALTVAKTLLDEGHPAIKVLDEGKEYCEKARDALLTIQFNSAQI